jgi:hypothetical protein
MLRIDDTIFSFDILEKQFCCDLPVCLGNCCRYGDSGAPLSMDETQILNEILPVVKPFMRSAGIETIEKLGTSVSDFENERVTPLINGEECAYTIIENDIYYCAIERAWSSGKTTFRKPLSCHLFPAKFKQFSDFRAVNYQELKICQAAREKGERETIYVYEFLKEPLTRALGPKMYEELCEAGKELKKNPRSWNR